MKDNITPSFLETKEQRNFRQNYMKAINKAYRYDESIGIMDIGEDKKIRAILSNNPTKTLK